MKLLMLSGDPAILDRSSRSHARMQGYARQFEALHVVVACRRSGSAQVQDGLYTYPVRSGSGPGRALGALVKGWGICRSVRPDLVSTQDADLLGLIGYLLARRFKIHLQVQVHTDLFNPRYRQAGWRERVRVALARFVLPRATCIRAVSEHVAASIADEIAIPASRIRVLPIFTDIRAIDSAGRLDWVEDRVRGHALKMIAAGRFIDREKGFSTLLQAYADVVHMLPNPVLALVGEGPDRTLYEAMIGSLDLAGRVWLVPWQDDLFSFMKSFDIFLNTSHFEGWGRGPLEAAAAGLAVITTGTGAASRVFTNGLDAHIVPVGDRPAIARAMVDVALDPVARMGMARAGQAMVRSLLSQSWDEYFLAYRMAIEGCRDAVKAQS